jgi:hypothetical protein
MLLGCCFTEIALLVVGIVVLVLGNFRLSGSRVVPKVPGRIIGVILMLPLILAQAGGFAIGFVKGAQAGAQGKQFGPEDVVALEKPILVLHFGVTGLAFVAAIGIAVATAQPTNPKRRRIREEDYDNDEYDDRPRRRRRDDDNDDDRPRRRARDEDDDDDRPRRRSEDDDDDQPRRRRPDDRDRER